MIKYKCKECGSKMESPESLIWQYEKCPVCGTKCLVKKSRKKIYIIVSIIAVALIVIVASSYKAGKSKGVDKGRDDTLTAMKVLIALTELSGKNNSTGNTVEPQRNAPVAKPKESVYKEPIRIAQSRIVAIIKSYPKYQFTWPRSIKTFENMAAEFRRIDISRCPRNYTRQYHRVIQAMNAYVAEAPPIENVFGAMIIDAVIQAAQEKSNNEFVLTTGMDKKETMLKNRIIEEIEELDLIAKEYE